MKVLWGLGKALTLIFWAVVLSNLYQPLINPFDVLVNLVASLLLLTHVLEVLFYTTRLQNYRVTENQTWTQAIVGATLTQTAE